jgi:cytochrome b6-f complex iron-sulfur subunit
MGMTGNTQNAQNRQRVTRRRLLTGGFLASLAAAYGLFASRALEFIFPEKKSPRIRRIFLAFVSDIPRGASRSIPMPSGDQLLLSNTRRLNPDTGNTFVAFSNSCPHLGCKVHWEALEEHFVCPCHQGVFNAEGVAISGPPSQSGSSLRQYQIEVSGNSIYAVVEEV